MLLKRCTVDEDVGRSCLFGTEQQSQIYIKTYLPDRDDVRSDVDVNCC